uniref:BURP domain-containing protein n=1 Tax=Setaria digitata TaxID=48799 RepID=A0A915Q145_9BILA
MFESTTFALCFITLFQYVLCSKWIEYAPSREWDAGQSWGKDGVAWGGFNAATGGKTGAREYGDKAHKYGDRDHAGFAYGSKGAADGFSEFAKRIADGHIADALEAGERALAGVEGHKKYSYFAQGSGPHGFYSKGYWGTNGYDHESAKEAHVKDAKHGGFKEGYEHADADHGLAHAAWDKIAHSKDNHKHGHNHGVWKHGAKEWDNSNHQDGWEDSSDGHLHKHHHGGEMWN